MILKFLVSLLCLCMVTFSFAQDGNWKKNAKTAEQYFATGNYEEAASYFLEAYKQKNNKPEFLMKAAECYDKLKFYTKAANFYRELVGKKDFPTAGLKYGQALKQNGDYGNAMAAYKSFLVNYQGANKDAYVKLIKNEVLGCEYALSDKSTNKDLIIEHLGSGINTMADEVAPLPFNDDILYFTSTMDGFSKIFRSQYRSGEWSKSMLPKFPEFKNFHVSHGTFTPDNQRFYFTLCSNTDFDVVNAQCDIYVTVREESQWSTPRKLRDYVKLGGNTATHPFVMHDGEMEVLYFASDRSGGKGGMDIWFMTRHVDSPEYDFTLPKNLGDKINTSRDEISPFYDAESGFLYFSSNGHPGIGGFDVFKSMGSMTKFSTSQNVGRPINSSADDYYYVENKSKTGSFVSSNRTFGSEKISTDNNDIFHFSLPVKEIFARGNIYDHRNNSIVNDVQVILYEVKNSGKKRLLQSIIANNGAYQFALIPERSFEIVVIKENFEEASYNFNTFGADPDKEFGKPIYLEKESMITKTEMPVFNESSSVASVDRNMPIPSAPPSTERTIVETSPVIETTPTITSPDPIAESTTSATYTNSEYVNSYYKEMEVTTAAPRLNGVYYKVQIATADFFTESDPLYDNIRHLGVLQTENIQAKGWTRVLISEFYSLSSAREAMDTAKENGFPQTFVVRYQNGDRKN